MNKLKIGFLIAIICLFLTVPAWAVDETPKLVILSPSDGSYTNSSSIQITGVSESGALLSINGKTIPNSNGNFVWSLNLEEGLNNIVAKAQKNGEISEKSINVTLDTINPEISINPVKKYINTTFLNLSYTSGSDDVEIYRVRLNDGEWNTTYELYYPFNLTEGATSIEVLAVDHAGNTGKADVNFTVDITPPFIEITKPDFNETIKSKYLDAAGRTEIGSILTINGVNVNNDNGTWNIPLVLSGVNNVFNIESVDLAGNKAERTIKVKLGANISKANFLFNFLSLKINFSQPGRFEGENDAVVGKYVSYIFNINDSTFSGYSIIDTMWFNRVTINGFKPENTSMYGPVAVYEQKGSFGKQHSTRVEVHDNDMGTILLDIRHFEDIYGKVREHLLNKPKQRLKINVSRDKNVTIEGGEGGTQTPYYIDKNWTDWPEVTYELAKGVTASEISNGYKFKSRGKEAYLFKANFAGGSSNFTLTGNKLVARVNNSLLIFRKFPDMNMTDADILDNLISQAISDGIIGLEFFIDDIDSYDMVTFGDITLIPSFPDPNTMEFEISSTSKKGTVIAVGMTGNFFINTLNKNLTMIYDGTEMHQANGFQDILDVTDDMGHAEYLIAAGNNGRMVLISIPGFSIHTIAFKFENQPGIFGSAILGILNFLSGGLFLFLPGTSWEMAFSIWWLAIVSIIYIVIRKTFRNG